MRKIVKSQSQEKELNFDITKPVLHGEQNTIESHSSELKNNRLATVVIESYFKNQRSNEQRLNSLKATINFLSDHRYQNGIIIFPAGMFYTEKDPPSSIYTKIEEEISSHLVSLGKNFIVVFGIDGSEDVDEYARDQIAVALNQTGIIALGRKFYPQKTERGHVNLAKSYNTIENEKPRIFNYRNQSFYLAMCYDSFGIKNQNIKNPGVTGLIELAHCFYPKGVGPSGELYFARHGFAGASRQWNCPVFGTGVFFDRAVPERWPTGVMWNQGNISTRDWKYEMNPVEPEAVLSCIIPEGKAVIRVFSLGK